MMASRPLALAWILLSAASPLVVDSLMIGRTPSCPKTIPSKSVKKCTTCFASSSSDAPDDDTVAPTTPNRREALLQFQASMLAAAMATAGPQPSYSAADDNNKPCTILMTGANSGIGLEAVKRLATRGAHTTIFLACRSMEKAQAAVATIRSSASSSTVTAQLIPLACDLADLSSIEVCAQQVIASSTNTPIETLCLNAGLARNAGATDCVRTKDGWEQTVGVNHVGHFYLTHLLLPRVSRNGKIVVTASGVHDPESPGGAQGIPATLGALQGLETMGRDCEMVDGGAFNGDKAYKDSKLCNVLFTRELQRRLSSNSATNGISANCFNPGLIVSTGLFRDQNPFFTKLFDFAATDLLKVGESPAWGGGCLEYLTSLDTKGLYYSSPPGSVKYGDAAYGDQFCPTTVSQEAQDAAKAQRLWDLTAKDLGIQTAV